MANAGSVVALVFGAIFLAGGIWAVTVYEQCASLLASAFCTTAETEAVFALVLGIVLIIVAVATWGRKSKSRRRKAAAGGA